MKSTLLIIPFLSLPVVASENCSNLKDCLEVASKLTSKKFIYSNDLKGEVNSIGKVEWTKNNVNLLLSNILFQNDYAEIKINEGFSNIIPSRDIRYHSLPTIHVNSGDTLVLDKDYEYSMLTLKLKHPENASAMIRSFRPFLSRYGRVIDNKLSGTVTIQDTGVNIHRFYEYAKSNDKKVSKEALKRYRNYERSQYRNKENNKNNNKKGA